MQNYLFCTLLALFCCLFSNCLVLKIAGSASNLKLTLCQPSSCWVYFSKHGGLNSVKGEEGATSFICHDEGE